MILHDTTTVYVHSRFHNHTYIIFSIKWMGTGTDVNCDKEPTWILDCQTKFCCRETDKQQLKTHTHTFTHITMLHSHRENEITFVSHHFSFAFEQAHKIYLQTLHIEYDYVLLSLDLSLPLSLCVEWGVVRFFRSTSLSIYSFLIWQKYAWLVPCEFQFNSCESDL